MKDESQELAVFAPRDPLVVLTDREEFDKFFADIKRTVADFVPDITTQKGRDAIKALAFKVTKTKTFLDGEGKRLTDDARKTITAVDASRRHMREQLEALKDEVRAPLDNWEKEEASRIETVNGSIAGLRNVAIIPASMTFDDALQELEKVKAYDINEAFYRERTGEATALRQVAIDNLSAALDRLKREEEERAELGRLRREKEAAEQAEVERRRQELEKQEAERRECERAEQKAIAEAQQKAREERAAQVAADARARELEEKHQVEVRREREKREQAERENEARIRAKKAEEDEQRKRDTDKAHRREVMTAAKAAIMECGIEEEKAKTIVVAIIAGEIPNVTLRF